MSRKPDYSVSAFETFSYSIYSLGQNVSSSIILLYLVVFFTDIGIPVATVAILTLIVKVWDAVNDPIFGGIVDKVHFKSGKFIPWLRVALVLLPISTILLFAIPSGLSLPAKVVLVGVGYILWDMAYTICDLPIFALVTTMTANQHERTKIMSIARIFGLSALVIASVGIPLVRERIGGWFLPVLLLSIVTVITMAPICFVAKERVKPVSTGEDFGLREMGSYLLKNKYLLLFNLAIVIGCITNASTTLGVIVARYCLGNESYLGLLSLASILPALIFGALLPALTKKVDKFHVFFGASLLNILFGVIQYFIGYENLPLFFIVAFIRNIPFGVALFMMFMFTPDCVEYGLYRSGTNASGIAFSIQTFTAKLTVAIGTVVGSVALAWIGFVEGEGAVQLDGFAGKLWFAFTALPAVGTILSIPLLRKYKLRDDSVQIMAKANCGEITREEAERLLAGKI